MFKIIGTLIKAFFVKLERMGLNEFNMENYLRKRGMQIGTNNRVYSPDLAGEPYLVKIGNHCTITSGVSFITHDGAAWVFREEIPGLQVFGKIEIKDNCFIGFNSIILPNVTIGPNSVVGAGSVVVKDVPPDTVVAGVPARPICSIGEYKRKCIERWKALKLTGTRDKWEKQLKEHFWPAESGPTRSADTEGN